MAKLIRYFKKYFSSTVVSITYDFQDDPISKGYNSKTMHFWPHVGKAIMRLREGSF